MTEEIFDKYTGLVIPILEWTFLKEGESEKWLQKHRTDVKPLARDMGGDYICLKDSNLMIVDHEQLEKENDYEIGDDFGNILKMLDLLLEIPDYNEETTAKELRGIKKQLKEIEKIAPDSLDYFFEDEIEEVKDLVEDWKFYQTVKGKRYLELVKYQKIIARRLNQPKKFTNFRLIHRADDPKLIYYFGGYCDKPNEDIEYVKEVIDSIDFPHPVEFKSMMSYEQYLEYMEKLKEK